MIDPAPHPVAPARPPRLLSFVVPAHNCAATLDEAVQGVLEQELAIPFEVVAVDDASTDNTHSVLEELRTRHPNVIRVYRNERNLGGGPTRNRAIAEARGDVLYIADADNVMPPGTVQPQVELISESGLHAASVERLDFFIEDVKHVTHSWHLVQGAGGSGLQELFSSTKVPPAHGNYAFTRQLFEAAGGYESGRGAMESWTFGMKHIVRGFDVGIALGTHYFHRIGHAGYWAREEALGTNDVHAIQALREQLEHIPADLRTKVGALHERDPFFAYLEAGCFTPTGRLPSPPVRYAARAARRVRHAKKRMRAAK